MQLQKARMRKHVASLHECANSPKACPASLLLPFHTPAVTMCGAEQGGIMRHEQWGGKTRPPAFFPTQSEPPHAPLTGPHMTTASRSSTLLSTGLPAASRQPTWKARTVQHEQRRIVLGPQPADHSGEPQCIQWSGRNCSCHASCLAEAEGAPLGTSTLEAAGSPAAAAFAVLCDAGMIPAPC
jgi:hypothetical protein